MKSWIFLINTSIRELQRHARSNRLEIDNITCGYEESRTEHARLHEELAQREKALRDTCIRSIHEVEELKRARNMRIDKFTRHEMRESHATVQERTSQVQELQGQRNIWVILQGAESSCSGKFSHYPSPPCSCSKSLLYAKLWPKSAIWYMELAWYIGNRFWRSTCSDRFVIDTLSRNASLLESKCYRWEPGTTKYREICRQKCRNKIEMPFQSRDWQGNPAEGSYPQNYYMADQQRLQILMTIMFRNSIRDGTKLYCRCQKFHSMMSWKVCTN